MENLGVDVSFLSTLCPACRLLLRLTLQDDDSVWSCETCGTDNAISELDWVDNVLTPAFGKWKANLVSKCLCGEASCPTCNYECIDCGRYLCVNCAVGIYCEYENIVPLCTECANSKFIPGKMSGNVGYGSSKEGIWSTYAYDSEDGMILPVKFDEDCDERKLWENRKERLVLIPETCQPLTKSTKYRVSYPRSNCKI